MRKVILAVILNLTLAYSVIPNAFSKTLDAGSPLDSNIYKFLPMNVGNKWVYLQKLVYNENTVLNAGYAVMEIVDTLITNNHKYFRFSVNYGFSTTTRIFQNFVSGPNEYYLRIDSISGNIMSYSSGSNCYNIDELMFDSLTASQSNFFRIECHAYFDCAVGTSTKSFRYNQPNFHRQRTYTLGQGLSYSVYNEYFVVGYTTSYELRGYIIDGVLYGDTTITNVNHLETEIPSTYSLHQNYPNPFNPSTKIKFGIPKGALVKLKVYDILGREVAELVNERLNAGVYEYEWSGVGGGLPSGVYFYRLEAGEFTETKRMVLVK